VEEGTWSDEEHLSQTIAWMSNGDKQISGKERHSGILTIALN
jgi:hypothetical protein